MHKLYYSIGLSGLGLLVLLGGVWFSGPLPWLQTTPAERPIAPSTTAVAPASLVPPDPAAPADGPRVDLQAVTAELAAVQRQHGEALATLRQQQETQLAALQQRLERLFTAQRALTRRFDNSARRAASDEDAPLSPDAASAEQATEQVTQTHEAQAVDPTWSTQAQTAIEQSFQKYGAEIPEAVLLDTECRTTVCRMEVAFETDSTRDDVLMRLPHMIPWNAHGLLHVDPQSNTVLFYVAREGERLDTAR
jgi:hypothetical protein